MKILIAIIAIFLGSYFTYTAGKTLYNSSKRADFVDYESVDESNGQYQEIVIYEEPSKYEQGKTYALLVTGIVLIVCGCAMILYKAKPAN